MKIEFGKTYITRAGQVVKVIDALDESWYYPFSGDNGISYSRNGQVCINETSDLDLVKEYIEMNEIDQELEKLQKDYEQKKADLERKKRLIQNPNPNEVEIAEFLHERFCGHNHTDGCGWLYDDGDWSSFVRKQYLNIARNLLKCYKKEMIYEFVNILRER